MIKNTLWNIGFIAFLLLSSCGEKKQKETTQNNELQKEVQAYLDHYNSEYQHLLVEASEASWKLNTMIVEGDTVTNKIAEKAEEAMAKFTGSKENIEKSLAFLKSKDQLTSLQVKQLEAILYFAGSNPETVSDIVLENIKANTEQTKKLFGFKYEVKGEEVSTNDIDKVLKNSNDPQERLMFWRASKEVGKDLKGGLERLRDLRNQSVQALDYDDYFHYQVSEYGMTSKEMLELNKQMISDIWPLYRELHTWARYTLAKKYGTEVPKMIPAHWLPNRWGQDWTALVDVKGLDLDEVLGEKSAEWIVREGERFYQSLGFEALPESFYTKSSLYPLPDSVDYKKNNHASAWHMDNANDVRSLMSIEPNTEWWETTLHELGHIYYYITYTNDDVPIILRGGANRAYHEAMGSLMGLASLQKPFLQDLNLIESNVQTNDTLLMLKEALNYVVLLPWASGVMTEFEYELYGNNLPQDQFNAKWWEIKEKYQGIQAPENRGEEYCDAASKTHINNDPAQYYDYALSYILLFQFHDHIAKNILKQDPHATNYYGNKEVGNFIKNLMKPGASVDWRAHLQENLGTGMSAKPMLDYFDPLYHYLKKENKEREHTLPAQI